MNSENTKALIKRFKFISSKNPLYRNDLNIPMSFDCEDGWFKLIWELCEGLEKIIDKSFIVEQVKEKFGTLRFYVSYVNDDINSLIEKAELQSSITCEICGNPGELKIKRGWYRTVCEDEKDYQQIKKGNEL
jgi:hypothetical protein